MQYLLGDKLARQKVLIAAVMAALSQITYAEDTLSEVTVSSSNIQPNQPSEKTKSYTVKSTASATRLDASIRETPQSISVITRELIDDFKLNNVNDVLDYATGIKVERTEPARSYYTARGSDITNFQIDGIGTPFAQGLVFGDLDTATYDRVEVLRGANGLLTGTGNPSATINFIRKRPTKGFQAEVSVSAGSWDYRRLDADLSSSLNESGSVRGRVVLASMAQDSYLDRYSMERNVAYGIIEADITDNTQVALGHTYQKHDASGNMWGGLPLLYADGSKRHYNTSDSTAPDWTYWNTAENNTFAELTHYFDSDWKVKTQLTRKELISDSRLLYIYGNEDKATGTGLGTYPGKYHDVVKEWIADAYFSGPFSLAGRKHEAVFGVNWSKSTITETEKNSSTGVPVLNSFEDAGNSPLPDFSVDGNFANRHDKRFNTYAAVKFNVSDDLKLTTGANMLSYEYKGVSYSAEQNTEANNKITPYLGAVYDLNKQHSVYASYTGIYNPQVSLDKNFKPLAPVEGKNYEIGLKSEWLDNKLNTSFALFKNTQENVAQSVDTVGITTIYEGIDADTKGYEFDVSGEISSNLSVNAGYTRLMSIKDKSGDNVKPYTPKNMAHASTTYKVPSVQGLKLGASVNWQDDTHVDIDLFGVGQVRYKQDSYAVVNLMANYEFNKHWSTAFNLYNVTNEKYLASLMWGGDGQSYYAAPFNGAMTLTWKY